jgi:hypothetical protein
MGRALAPLSVLVLVLLAALPAAAQDASPSPATTGELASATREYRAAGNRLTGIIDVAFRVGEFATAADAHTALLQIGPAVLGQPGYDRLRPAPAPAVADESLAFAGPVTQNGVTIKLAVLLVRDGREVHTWTAAGFYDDPLPALLALAERWFARAGTPVASPAATIQPQDLLARLPTAEDLPAGSWDMRDRGTW